MEHLTSYFGAFVKDWVSLMSGIVSLVLTILSFVITRRVWLKRAFVVGAILSFFIASVDVWAVEFKLAEGLRTELNNLPATSILPDINFRGMQPSSPVSIFVPLQPIVAQLALANKGPYRAEDFSPYFEIAVLNSQDEEENQWDRFSRNASKAQPPLRRTWDFGIDDAQPFVFAQTNPLGQEEAYELQAGKKFLYTLFVATWHQASLSYRQEMCRYLAPPGDQNHAELCRVHNTTRLIKGR